MIADSVAGWTVPEVVRNRAHRAPEATALLAPGRAPLTYKRLQELTLHIAALLRAVGIGPEDRVAVVLPAGPEMAVAFLGIASTAVCAPLNPAYTAAELEFYLNDLQARALVVSTAHELAIHVAHRLGVPTLQLSPDQSREAGAFTCGTFTETLPEAGASCRPEDIALVLHTSGTTARPKIVPLTHRNLCATARNICGTLLLSPADRCLVVMPLFHIHGLVGALLSSLWSGASAICTPGFSANDFTSWLRQMGPTWYTAVPTMHQAILVQAERHPEEIAGHSLRLIRSSSAALPPPVMSQLEEVFGVPVIESYGMTEAAHQMASNPLPPGKRKPGSVGIPAGPEIAVMNSQGDFLPAGRTGEIAIRGENVIQGYDRDAEANARAFSRGWFRTGDEGCFDDEGYLFVTGRIKEMINRGGEKISPREVDEVLLLHPAVSQAVTFAIPHRQLGEEVGAAVVLKPGASASPLEIREFSAGRLAAFKVPRLVLPVSEIPRGATGKIQRIGLAGRLGVAAMDDSESHVAAEYMPPTTPLERKLWRIWSEILKTDAIGAQDDFFFLGGDSIAAAQLLARVGRETNAGLSFVRFLEAPTIRAMAEEITRGGSRQGASAATARLIPIQPNGTRPPLYFAAGHDGSLMLFSTFARYSDPERPVLAFPPFEPAANQTSYRLEELAADYVSRMRAHQPEGPYYLAGICHGGFTVFEMARQLESQGQPVAILAMLDTYNPHESVPGSPFARISHGGRFFRERLLYHWNQLQRMNTRERFYYIGGRCRAAWSRVWNRVSQTAFNFRVAAGRPVPPFLRDVRFANTFALKGYVPGVYSGSAILFRVIGLRPDAPRMGWAGFIRGDIEMIDAPYHHSGIAAESTLQLIARHLQIRLEEADRQHDHAAPGDRDIRHDESSGGAEASIRPA